VPGQVKDASDALAALLDAAPRDWRLHLLRLSFLVREKKYEEAEGGLQSLLGQVDDPVGRQHVAVFRAQVLLNQGTSASLPLAVGLSPVAGSRPTGPIWCAGRVMAAAEALENLTDLQVCGPSP
jgi:predicted Zn-dependent protease